LNTIFSKKKENNKEKIHKHTQQEEHKVQDIYFRNIAAKKKETTKRKKQIQKQKSFLRTGVGHLSLKMGHEFFLFFFSYF
jgi:hypothetical protein